MSEDSKKSSGWATIIAEKMSPKAIYLVLGAIVIFVAALFITSIATHREITFYPPSIGADKEIARQITALRSSIDVLQMNELAHRDKLLAEVQRTREVLIQESSSIVGAPGPAMTANNAAEVALSDENEIFLKKISNISDQLQKLTDKLN